MKYSGEILFSLSLFVPALMGLLSYVSFRQQKSRELLHLTEFWASLFVSTLMMLLFQNSMSNEAALTMLGWIWPMRTFNLLMMDISGQKIMGRWHILFLGLGAFISFALATYDYSFTVFTIPFSFAVGVTGLFVLGASFKKISTKDCTPLHKAVYFFMGLFFLRRLIYPFWRLEPSFFEFGIATEVLLLIGLAGSSLSTYMEMLRKNYTELMEKILKERSEKFLGQSKYSELGMMSAGIAHEINNPLAVIQARTTQLLRIYRNPEKQKDLADGLAQILYTSERINKTIQGIREFVHQDETAPPQEVTLKDLFDDVLAFCGQRMKNHGVNLRFYGLENFSVIGHKIQLEQVILNLLNNSFDAIEYLPDKWIEVSGHKKDDKIQLFFKDSGKGIPKDVAAHMMEPFFTTKAVGKGTGLGLALAKGIIEQHGGSLKYLDDCQYTTFLLELPYNLHREWGIPLH